MLLTHARVSYNLHLYSVFVVNIQVEHLRSLCAHFSYIFGGSSQFGYRDQKLYSQSRLRNDHLYSGRHMSWGALKLLALMLHRACNCSANCIYGNLSTGKNSSRMQ